MVLQIRTKGDLIQDALSKMKISGITAPPDAEDTQLMVQRLEGMLYEFQERGLCLEYNFTMDPDPADFHGLEFYAFQPVASILAFRSVQDFGLEAPQTLVIQARAGNDLLSSRSTLSKLRQVEYPSRHPRGSGNTQRYIRWRTFYPETRLTPLDCSKINIRAGEVDDFTEDYSAELRMGETILFFAVETTTGLTFVERSRTTNRINYRLSTAVDTDTTIETARFTVTSSTGRVIIRDKIVEVELNERLGTPA